MARALWGDRKHTECQAFRHGILQAQRREGPSVGQWMCQDAVWLLKTSPSGPQAPGAAGSSASKAVESSGGKRVSE